MFLPVSSVRGALSRLFLIAVFAATAAAQAQVPAPLAKPNIALTLAGEVSSVAYQPDGALLLVGTFTSIDGVPRDGLARLRPDGSLDQQWYPRVRWLYNDPTFASRHIHSLPDGGVLLVGDVSHFNGQSLMTCGAVKLSGGPGPVALLPWAESCAGADFTFDDQGWYYYIGGWSSQIRRARADTGVLDDTWFGMSGSPGKLVYDGNGGLIQSTGSLLIRVLTATGERDPNWQVANPGDDVLVGGGPDPAGGYVHLAFDSGRIAKLSMATGQSAAGWPQIVPHRLQAFARDGSGDLYVGGWQGVSRVSAQTGQVLARWPVEGERKMVRKLATRADGRVVAAGDFARLGDAQAMGLALIAPAAPQPVVTARAERQGGANRLARQTDGALIMAGTFDRADGVDRMNLLRLHPDGSLDMDWAPRVDGWIRALALGPDGDLYVGGTLDRVNGELAYAELRKFDGSSGAVVQDYFPETDTDFVSGLVVDASSRVYFTGSRLDRPVRRLLPDGSADWGWGTAGSTVTSNGLQRLGTELYASVSVSGGDSTLRHVSMLTGAVDAAWSLDLSSYSALSVARAADGDLIIGGYFDSINGIPRRHLARVSATAPVQVRDWNPSPNNGVYGVDTTTDGRLFVSGYFTQIGGRPRNGNAELSLSDGTALDSWIAPWGGMGQLLTDERIYFISSPRGVIAYPLDVGDTIFATPFE